MGASGGSAEVACFPTVSLWLFDQKNFFLLHFVHSAAGTKRTRGGGTSQIIGILRPLIWKRGKRERKRIKKTLACDFWRPRQNGIFCRIRLPNIPTLIWKKNPRSELIEVGRIVRIGENPGLSGTRDFSTYFRFPTWVQFPIPPVPTYGGRRERPQTKSEWRETGGGGQQGLELE